MKFIAKVKTISPFGFKSKYTWDELFNVANKYGSIISVHTDPLWGGSMDLLRKARDLTDKPLLAKGIHDKRSDIETAFKIGADYVLQVGGIPLLDNKIIYEPTSLAEFKYAFNLLQHSCDFNKKCFMINNRNIETGEIGKLEEYDKYIENDLYGTLALNLIQASNIKKKEDIKGWATGFIIGEYLMEYCEENYEI